MYSTAVKFKTLTYFSCFNNSSRLDLYWLHKFINHWNVVSLLHSATTFFEYHIYADNLGSWDFEAILASFWFQLPWPMEWYSIIIMVKELVLIIVSCAVWGPLLKQRRTEFHCDNQGLLASIKKDSCKDAMVIHLLRCLWFFNAVFDIHIPANHITGKFNNVADILSRNQTAKFLKVHPHMPTSPTPLPSSLLHLVPLQMLD